MKLQTILKEWGLKVNDIKSRIDSESIEVNGVVVTDIRMDIGDISQVISSGSWFSVFQNTGLFDKWKNFIPEVFELRDIMSGESNIKNDLTEFLKEWKMVQLASHETVFVKLGKSSDKGILFDIEGQKPQFRKVDDVSEIVVDVDKLKSSLEKVNKQLNNKGFVENAPKFKVDEAKARKARLEEKLASVS